MSMLSSMCEKLRKTADEVERIKHNNADWLWRDGVTLMDAVRELRDAADVINSLRTTCQDLQFENEKLRDLIFDILVDEERGHNDDRDYYEHIRLARELGIDGIEVN